MAIASSVIITLDVQQRNRLECLLVDFERSWHEGRLAQCAAELPTDISIRRAALMEMVKIDLERGWQSGRQPTAEEYARSFPELLASDGIPLDLIQAEFESRRRAGEVDLDAFCSRFPDRGESLRALLARLPESDRGHWSTVVGQGTHPGGASSGTGEPLGLPERFGRYLIRRRLGQGGMGTVFLAHDTDLGRDVALKVPRIEGNSGSDTLERFYREARAAAALHHPNLCPVFDVGQIDGVYFLTMAFIEGRNLAEDMRDKPRSPSEAAALVRQLALALDFAHRHGVIHRDLKPANVLLNTNGEPAITDFGLARRINNKDERLTQTGAIMGTPAYMSPEQVEGDNEAVGAASDIYALGVILYELLTGRLPFRGSMASVMAQIVGAEPERPSLLRPDLHPQLEVIVMRAMKKKAEDRYATMGEFAAALGYSPMADNGPREPINRVKHLMGETPTNPVTTVPLEGQAIEKRPPSRKRRWIPVAVVMGMAAAMLAGGIAISNKDKDNKTDNGIKAPEDPKPDDSPGTKQPGTALAPKGAKDMLATGKHAKGVTLEVVEIKRTAEDLMQVKWRYRNATDEPIQVYEETKLGRDFGTGSSISPPGPCAKYMFAALTVAYSSEGKAWKGKIVKDGEGKLWHSSIGELTVGAKGTSPVYYARFGLPPKGVQKMSITFKDVDEPIELTLPDLSKVKDPGDDKKQPETVLAPKKAKDLFNGKDLAGWEGLEGVWEVKDGMIFASTFPDGRKKNTFLCSKEKFKNFELEFDARVGGKNNSGVMIRSRLSDRTNFWLEGIKCDFGPVNRMGWGNLVTYDGKNGRILRSAADSPAQKKVKADDFNHVVIRCVGQKVIVTVNGAVAQDTKLTELAAEGVIAFQLRYGDPTEVAFKNIRIREVSTPDNQPVSTGPEKPKDTLAAGKHAKGVTLEVVGIKRTAEDLMQVSWRYRNATDEPIQVYEETKLSRDFGPGSSISAKGPCAKYMFAALSVAYSSEGKAWKGKIVKDGEGKLWHSSIGELTVGAKGTSPVYFARFGLPPKDVRKMSINFKDVDEPIEVALPDSLREVSNPGKQPGTAQAKGKHTTGVILEVVAIERTAENHMQVSWRYRNLTDDPIQVYEALKFGRDFGIGSSITAKGPCAKYMFAGLFVAYSSERKVSSGKICKDSGGKLWHSNIEVLTVEAKGTSPVYFARFGLPPKGVRKMSITFKDVDEPIELTLPDLSK